ncbi:tripartite motif-containing protein 16-like [Clarias gariepinus]|uniref:tripartite motif-containing protein 16-like n=1 Tax=Clarias gariepinus TaxID=13013 RepID=UPI00234DA4CF|nr:tripartite motif-containing protein 16-like [Clarias gariepinus]
MAEASISVAHNQFNCPLCLDLLKDSVTLHCGHNYCKVCINRFWNKEGVRRVYSCPQCRETFASRPVLCRNNMLAEMVEKQNKAELQAASPAQCYAGPGDVECDSCIGRKRKAVNSCLVCQASYCEDHLQPHYQSPAFKKHKLVEACADLQEKICSPHDKPIEIYCRTDQSFICYLCEMDKHRGHDTVSTKTERTEKQNELKEQQLKSQQRIKEKQKKVQELKQAVVAFKRRSQAAVNDSEKIFTEMISFMEKKRSEATELIKNQEKAELGRAERLLKQLEQEIADLKRRVTELEQLSHTHDDIHFLQSFPSLCVSPGCEDSPSFTVNQHLTFDGERKSLSDLKKQVNKVCQKEFNNIRPQAAALFQILPLQLKSRKDFLQYFRFLTLDPNTAHPALILSEMNRSVTNSWTEQRHINHPERFDSWTQVLCEESVCGRCYWEVEWSGDVYISVSYKEISRKGRGYECRFGFNNQSWSLMCSHPSVSFWHNKVNTLIRGPASSRIGVYVDYSAGILSFYNVSNTMSLLHSVHTTFTQPLYAGFWVSSSYTSSVRLCDPKIEMLFN